MSEPDWDEVRARITLLDPAWVLVRNENRWYSARRDYWGNQQIITAPTLEELEASVLALHRYLGA